MESQQKEENCIIFIYTRILEENLMALDNRLLFMNELINQKQFYTINIQQNLIFMLPELIKSNLIQ